MDSINQIKIWFFFSFKNHLPAWEFFSGKWRGIGMEKYGILSKKCSFWEMGIVIREKLYWDWMVIPLVLFVFVCLLSLLIINYLTLLPYSHAQLLDAPITTASEVFIFHSKIYHLHGSFFFSYEMQTTYGPGKNVFLTIISLCYNLETYWYISGDIGIACTAPLVLLITCLHKQQKIRNFLDVYIFLWGILTICSHW